jgi:hypothetical protein
MKLQNTETTNRLNRLTQTKKARAMVALSVAVASPRVNSP